MNIKIFCRCSFFPFLVGLRTYQHPCIENVDSFTYLGSMVTKDGGAVQDVSQRIRKANSAFVSSIHCGRTAECLLGRNSASSVVMSSRYCYYMDLRHGKKWKLPPQGYRPSLIAAYEESWTSIDRKWFQMKNFGEGQRKPRCPRRSKDGNEIG